MAMRAANSSKETTSQYKSLLLPSFQPNTGTDTGTETDTSTDTEINTGTPDLDTLSVNASHSVPLLSMIDGNEPITNPVFPLEAEEMETNTTSAPEDTTTNTTSAPEDTTTNATSAPEDTTTNTTSAPEDTTTNTTSAPEDTTTNTTIAVEDGNTNTIVVPLCDRTFATSNYKRIYSAAKAPLFQHDLLGAIYSMLKLFAHRLHPAQDRDTIEKSVNEFMKKVQSVAFKDSKALKDDVAAVAEYLWTSGKLFFCVFNGMELCSVLNAVIRDDVAQEVEVAATFFRSLNSRRVKRVVGDVDLNYPRNGETWRGGGFNEKCKKFFEQMKGKKYRVPGFLATSTKRSVATNFAFSSGKTHGASVMWRIKFDPRGKKHSEYRVRHMTFVSKTMVKGEQEYLFAPYSVFTLVSVEWSTKARKPHEFIVKSAVDNREEDEHLPLTPWY